MSRWEYLVRVFALDKEEEVVINYVQREYPDRDWKEMPKYDPLTLEAWLSECGREGGNWSVWNRPKNRANKAILVAVILRERIIGHNIFCVCSSDRWKNKRNGGVT